jgi:hypothetical protein
MKPSRATLRHERRPNTASRAGELRCTSSWAAYVNYIREILVRTEVLPTRNEYLERVGPWIDRHLISYPAEHQRLVRNYAAWYLLHRVRRSKRQLGRARSGSATG